MKTRIREAINESLELKRNLLTDKQLLQTVESMARLIINAYKGGNKVLFCGNGGSAADAQHLAAELSGRFYKNRAPLNAEALHVNSSFLTAVANDHSFDEVFSRMVQAKGQAGDVLVALSTSGNSRNILNAIEAAQKLSVRVAGLTGESGGLMRDRCHLIIRVPSNDTPRIQEVHILLGHIICELVEEALFGENI
jgi:D-sedoheptulose 7-phosphate isomerase